jgi:methionyl-tRNA formyltransferase
VGRKRELKPTPIKEVALKHNIEVFQPESIRTDYQRIIESEPDLIVTAAYGQFIPTVVINAPTYGIINIHASLLPKYRGGSPIHASIKNGDEYTGVTTMYTVKKMDAGDILLQEKVRIEDNDTAETMFKKLGDVGAELIITTINKLVKGEIVPTKQDEELVTISPNIKREDEEIDWTLSSRVVDCHVRGYHSWPGTFSVLKDSKVKIFPGRVSSDTGQPGEVLSIDKNGLKIACGEGSYIVEELQVQGKKRMLVKDFVNGNKLINKGDIFSK